MSAITPSSHGLQQTTYDKLQGLRQRRVWLLVVRSIAGAVAVFLAFLLAGSFVDKLWNISDSLRFGLSFVTYGVAIATILFSIYPLFRPWGLSDAARVIEQEVPQLKNKLLSAVELSSESDDPRFGSRDLRNELQSNVALEVKGLELPKVLPWKRIQRILLAMLGIALFVGLLSAIPGLNLPQHMMRLLFPTANIARPSLAEIQVVTPDEETVALALQEQQLFRAEFKLPIGVIARLPQNAELQISTDSREQTLNSITLQREEEGSSDRQAFYSASVLIDQADFRYRIVSDVGETPWYLMKAYARPVISGFKKAISPPDYAHSEKIVLEEEHGDVEAIAESNVEWSLQTNVELKRATLRWIDPSKNEDASDTLPFVKSDAGQWSVALTATESRRFQIDMVSEADLKSTFPSTHRMTVKPDRAPKVVWIEPKDRSRVIRPKSAARVSVGVQDEFPLNRLEQWTRLNRGKWKTESLEVPSGSEFEKEWVWEIAALNAKVGDLIEVKILATDRKEQVGESATIEWVVSGTELDSSRDRETLARERIVSSLNDLTPIIRQKQEKLKELTDAWRKDADNKGLMEDLRKEWISSSEEFMQIFVEKRAEIEGLMREIRNPSSLEEVMLLVDAITYWESEAGGIVLMTDKLLERDELASGNRKGMTDQIRGRYERVLYGAQRLFENSQTMAAHDILADFARDMTDAYKYQNELLRDSKSIGSEIWKREEAVLGQHLTQVGKEMGEHSAFMPGGGAYALREWGQVVEQLGERVTSLTNEGSVSENSVKSLEVELSNRVNVASTYGSLPNELMNSRRELFNYSGRTKDIIMRGVYEWQQERRFSADGSIPTESFGSMLDVVLKRRESRFSRGDHSGRYAADLGLANRAIEHQIELNSGNPSKIDEKLVLIANAVGVIEAGERVENAQKLLDKLQETERYAATGKIARTENPRLWDAFGQELELAQENIRHAGLPGELADEVNGLRWATATQSASQKITTRRWEWNKEAVSAATDIETIQAELALHANKLAPKVAEARALLAELAPKISELAKEAAIAAQEAKKETEKLQEELKAGEVPNAEERLEQNEARQEAAQEELTQQLEQALEDLAATQNLADKQELQTAQAAELAQDLIEAAENRTEQAAEKAEEQAAAAPENQATPELNQAVENLAKAQDREAEVMEAIAEHFSEERMADRADQNENSVAAENAEPNAAQNQPNDPNLENNDEPSALEQLAQKEFNETSPNENTEALENAEKLAELAEADPRELLKSLEQELTRNEAMQEELSDIARNLAEQSQRALENAAEREEALQKGVEQSDIVREPQRKEFAQELNRALDQAQKIAQRLDNEAQAQARQGKQEPAQEQLQQLADQLNEAVQEAREEAASGLNDDLKEAAQDLQQALQQAEPKIQETANALAQAKNQSPFENENQQKQAKANAENVQNQLFEQDRRNADQAVQQRQQQQQQAQQAVDQAQQQLAQAEQQRNQIQEQLGKQPDNAGLQQQMKQAEARVAEQQAAKSTTEQINQRAQQRLNEAQQARQQLENRPPELGAQNPNSELGERLSQQAASRAAELKQDLGEILNQAQFMDQTEARRDALANAGRQQENVQEQVEDAARDLDRAAAHQERLQAQQSAEALEQAAQRVAATANQQAQAAGDQLEQAAQPDSPTENPLRANAGETRRATETLNAANEALEQRAQELGSLLEPQANQNDPSEGEQNQGEQSGMPMGAPEGNQAQNQGDMNSQNNTGEQNANGENAPNNSPMQSNANQQNSNQQNTTQSSNNQSNSNQPNANQSNSSQAGQNQQNNVMQEALSQLSPRQMAELLDQLDQQLREPSQGIPPDSLNNQQGENSPSDLAALEQATQALSQQMQQSRSQQQTQSQANSTKPTKPTMATTQRESSARESTGMLVPTPTGSGSAKAFATDELSKEPIGSWSRLREKKSEEVVESEREGVSPRYRKQIENYFKLLSEKSRATDK